MARKKKAALAQVTSYFFCYAHFHLLHRRSASLFLPLYLLLPLLLLRLMRITSDRLWLSKRLVKIT